MAVVFYCECGRKYQAIDARVGEKFRCFCGLNRIIPLRDGKPPAAAQIDPDLTYDVPSRPLNPRRLGLILAGWAVIPGFLLSVYLGQPAIAWACLVALPFLAGALWVTREKG